MRSHPSLSCLQSLQGAEMNTHRFRGLLLIAARAVVRRVSHRRPGGNVPDRPPRLVDAKLLGGGCSAAWSYVPSRHLLRLPGPCGHRRNRDFTVPAPRRPRRRHPPVRTGTAHGTRRPSRWGTNSPSSTTRRRTSSTTSNKGPSRGQRRDVARQRAFERQGDRPQVLHHQLERVEGCRAAEPPLHPEPNF